MRSNRTADARKAMAGLIGFLARGAAGETQEPTSEPATRSVLVRADGARRKVDRRVLSLALSSGLIDHRTGQAESGDTHVYGLTAAGRAALKRWLSDPEEAFQSQHRALSSRSDPDHARLTINLAESPLAALSRLKDRNGAPFLAPDLLAAGERLRVDFTRGQLTPSIGQRWDPVRVGRQSAAAGGIGDLTDAAMAARQRVEAAIAAVGPDLSGVLLDACCFLKGLTLIERERQWPVRSAKLMLRVGLAALDRHYAAPRHVKRTAAPRAMSETGHGHSAVRRPRARPPHAP
ncbi:DUF6456 domain-containing protein [uncultured Hoeflea sp.]|uniref:DUF6456 domain-containing protein n=1 Tax=uncultured Hoeflea sp. TaxID=538666 RepID=UPI002627D50D|nr:DUF6456 domain-containing protein [uncultured Hoeflea sp.]